MCSVGAGTSMSPGLSHHWYSWFSVLTTRTGTHTICSPGSQAFGMTPLAVLDLQLVDGNLWEFSASTVSRTNSYNKPPYISIGSASLKNPNITY